MKWARALVLVAVVPVAAVIGACGSFSASPEPAEGGAAPEAGPETGPAPDAMVPDGGPVACGAESCPAGVTTCHSFDFTAGCPMADFSFTGDPDVVGVTNDCGGGKVHVAAANGLGIEAVFDVKTPGAFARMHVSARIAVTTWDGGRVFALGAQGVSLAAIQALPTPTGSTALMLCEPGGACSAQHFDSAVGAEHTFTLDVTGKTVSLSIDCQPFATFESSVVLPMNDVVQLSFGRTGTLGIDGTLDDLFVSYF